MYLHSPFPPRPWAHWLGRWGGDPSDIFQKGARTPMALSSCCPIDGAPDRKQLLPAPPEAPGRDRVAPEPS